MIGYRIDVLKALKVAGYSTYRIRKEKIMGESTLQQFRDDKPVSWEVMNLICGMLDMQPGDILRYVPDDEDN